MSSSELTSKHIYVLLYPLPVPYVNVEPVIAMINTSPFPWLSMDHDGGVAEILYRGFCFIGSDP